jgi:N-acetylglucosaminyl-diphospho-decaprenol L-rhamnosyltransferase
MSRSCSVCAVIVNYHTSRLTMDCIESLKGQLDPESDRIVVVDNASGPEEVESLGRAISDSGSDDLVLVLSLNENRGFSGGNNAGIRAVDAEYYLLTNSDTILLPDAVNRMREAFARRPEAGIVSPRLEWPDGLPQVSCFRRLTPFSEMIRSAETKAITCLLRAFDVPLMPRTRPSSPDWTSFACVMIKAETINCVGLMDDGYFMYFEDSDYCRRAWAAGFEVLNWPEARVVHLQGRSSDVEERSIHKKPLPAYYYRSRSRYFRKFYTATGLIMANILWVAGRTISISRQAIARKRRPTPEGESRAIWQFQHSAAHYKRGKNAST